MLRVYEKWRGISFIGDHFSAVARGSKLGVLILVYLGSELVGMCRFVVDNFYFQYCVEGLIGFHESTDSLAKVTDLDADIPQEGAA